MLLAALSHTAQHLEATPTLWLGCAFIFGACIASFINVVVWRLPIMLNQEWDAAAAEQLKLEAPSQQPFNLSQPASHCPHCKQAIHWFHNLPILGWLLLRGRCASCQAAISKRYPLVELVGALLATITAYYYPPGFAAMAAIGLVLCLLCLALIDWDTHLLPDSIVLPLLWAGLLINSGGYFSSLEQAAWGAAAGYGVLWACFKAFKAISGKDGMGYGDFKLLAALGAWFGWPALATILLLASVTGASFGIAQRLGGRLLPQQPIAFGPWLALAGMCHLWWGTEISALLLHL